MPDLNAKAPLLQGSRYEKSGGWQRLQQEPATVKSILIRYLTFEYIQK